MTYRNGELRYGEMLLNLSLTDKDAKYEAVFLYVIPSQQILLFACKLRKVAKRENQKGSIQFNMHELDKAINHSSLFDPFVSNREKGCITLTKENGMMVDLVAM